MKAAGWIGILYHMTNILLYKQESYEIVGAAMHVYNTLGAGFLEAVYQEALEIELSKRNIPFEAQKELYIKYDDVILKQKYRADIVCYDKIILEIKAVSNLEKVHSSQLYHYLHATGKKLGLLINFGCAYSLEFERIIL